MTSTARGAVQRYIDGFNAGDADAMAAVFDVSGSILDGMAPHVWQGPTAARDWYRDVLAEAENHGAANYRVTVAEPLHENITGEFAYLALPATMSFELDGQPVTQVGAVITMALRQRPEGWRIAAWAWTKGTQ
ncbi:hypothetical protein FHT44_004420 [Mycolicibacterium sp. BK634]|uniref:nuclear transport factor 2 family protein n=1 Tax=Mycolicibacterium sp. BK634 TaxID=2587099 RepID=UPI0016084015|nr:nuclear transport factor 2 family protein [Mycolicibacterium sp. BK634]MBB3751925.1 hypothetical protein [Mycolicibacterium sp. BK634]